MEPNLYQIRSLQRRAETILRKSEDLFYEVMRAYGEDGMAAGDNVSDFADNIPEATRDLLSILDRAAKGKKTTPTETS